MRNKQAAGETGSEFQQSRDDAVVARGNAATQRFSERLPSGLWALSAHDRKWLTKQQCACAVAMSASLIDG